MIKGLISDLLYHKCDNFILHFLVWFLVCVMGQFMDAGCGVYLLGPYSKNIMFLNQFSINYIFADE